MRSAVGEHHDVTGLDPGHVGPARVVHDHGAVAHHARHALCNDAATDDDGSCIFLGDACDDGNALTLGDVYTNCALANFGCQGVGPEVIYEETFQDLGADYGWTGTTNTAINETEWSIQVGGATDWFKTVSSNGDLIFEGRDTDFDCVWTTREIDVSGFTELEVSAAFSEVGALENADFVRIEYILDGQTTVIQTLSNDFGTNNIDQISIPDGNTVQLRVVLATNANNERIAFDDVYLFGVPNCVDSDGDGICNENDLCSDLTACNFSDTQATGCLFDDACGVCGGPGEVFECGCNDIPAGDCDCDGNQLDALNVCGGTCAADADADGICDDVDPCVGQLDICGVCNGPGAVLECGCSDIPAGDCDCDGNQADAIGECGGTCTADADSDGICDDVDTCIGTVDACGICNGPGAIYACGCSEIPAGDCDCDGNQADAIGVCGGSCTADADSDGICDDVDPCVGTVDACGVCEGPGDIFECGCNDIPAGDCDCDGNQLDAAGVCGGDCTSDVDGDGVCDTDEVPGCDDALAVNYNPLATDNDGSCTYLPASFDGLVAEAYALNSVAPGTHTFRVYAQFSNPNDQLVSVYGNAASPLSIESSTSFYQNILGDATADNLNPLLFGTDPLLEWDSFVAIGAADNSSTGIQSAGLDYGVFEAGGALTSDPTLGGSWFVFPDQEPQAFPDADGRVLIGQFTTDGTVTLQCNIQYRASDGTNPQVAGLTLVFPNSCPEDINGDGLVAVDDILILLSAFGCTGTGCTGDIDMDGVVGVSDILDVLGAFSTSCF